MTLQETIDAEPEATEDNFCPYYYSLLDGYYGRRGRRKSDKPVVNRYGDKGIAAVKPFVDACENLEEAKQAMLDDCRVKSGTERYLFRKELDEMGPEERASYLRHLRQLARANSGDIFTKEE